MKKQEGITLVALVVTIVIIIILSSVTLVATFGENGIIRQAELARDLASNSTIKEAEEMNAMVDEYSNIMSEGENPGPGPEEDKTPPTVEIIVGEITETSIAITANTTDDSGEIAKYVYHINGKEPQESTANTYTFTGLTAGTQYSIKVEAFDKANNKGEKTITASTTKPMPPDNIPLPDGFYYVGGTKNDGVVISDNPADEGKGTDHNTAKNVLQGNQFVWIPVENDSKFKRYEGYYKGDKQNILSYCTEPYTNASATEKSEYEKMKASVLEHNGFYVGRYETGTTTKRTSNSGIADEAVIKQGMNVYNYIGWSNSQDMTNEKGGAVEKAKNFAKDHNYSSVTSTLVYGVEWDAIMNYIDSAYETGSCKENSFVRDSTGKGWYSQSAPTTTGSNASYATKNIYDLGGNIEEWTMEANYADFRVIRGGIYDDTSSTYPASFRHSNCNPSYSFVGIGFRVALYL